MKLLKRDPIKGYLDALLWVPKGNVNAQGVKTALTFTFFSDKKDVTILELFKETEHHLLVPREFWDVSSLPFEVIDARPLSFSSTGFTSNITLDCLSPGETTQQDALSALLRARGGILQLACGKGKTVVALELACRMKVPTLIVVDNTHLLEQWREAILGKSGKRPALINIDPEEVGLIQADVFDWQKPIVLATYQTLALRAEFFPEEARRWFGLVIWDEAHHIAAPTFAKSADLFYGYRLGLTATPTRDDGRHVIYDFHLGKVIFKDLKQELRPRIYFLQTGLALDMMDRTVVDECCDKNGELHLSKLATHLGRWRERLDFILREVGSAVAAGRKILVLSNSIDACINLLALWTHYPQLYSDVPVPTELEVGAVVPPLPLEEKERKKILRMLPQISAQLQDPALNPTKRENLQIRKKELERRLKMDDVAVAVAKELRRRQRTYLKNLLAHDVTAGLMIHKVSPAQRAEMLRNNQVVFAITKYGREGLDEQMLDTILICEPMSSRNGLQQVMGRVLRKKEGKKHPVVIFLEDAIAPLMHMCRSLRSHLRDWPIDANGPYEYIISGAMAAKEKSWIRSSLKVSG